MDSKFMSRIQSRYEGMNKTETTIADYLSRHGEEACYLSISDVADKIGVSKSAVSRFVRKLGYKGYREMRIDLAAPPDTTSAFFFSDIEANSTMGIAQSIIGNGISSLSLTYAALNEKGLDAAVEILKNADICGLYGLGGSFPIAASAYHRFMRTSLTFIFQQDYHLQLQTAARLTKDDCALIISHTGRNKDMLRVAKIIHERDAPIVTITGNVFSPLAKMSQVVIPSISRETKLRPEALASSVSQILLVDTLFALYAIKVDNEPEYFSNIRKVVEETRAK
ncbi:MurR/RpiR family transcriptional regulator [Coriobacterium glomerans]|nr:MurR/RpiR family transcriptional regulator [Coriobacterium glomerans]